MAGADAMYRRALAGKKKAPGPDHTSTLMTVKNLGNLYKDHGKLAEAEAMYQRSLRGFEKALAPDHTPTLDTVHNLGLLHRQPNEYNKSLGGFARTSLQRLRSGQRAKRPRNNQSSGSGGSISALGR